MVSRRGGDKSPRTFRIWGNFFQNCLAMDNRSPLIRLKLRRGSLFRENGRGRDGPGFYPQDQEWQNKDSQVPYCALPLFLSPPLLPAPFYFPTKYILSADVCQTLDQALGSPCTLSRAPSSWRLTYLLLHFPLWLQFTTDWPEATWLLIG